MLPLLGLAISTHGVEFGKPKHDLVGVATVLVDEDVVVEATTAPKAKSVTRSVGC